MGKPKPSLKKHKPNKMADMIAERRKAGDPMKRSKSFRASLRIIGNKFLNHKSNEENMLKVKSLSNLTDFIHKKDFKRSISHDDSYLYTSPDPEIKDPVTSKIVIVDLDKIRKKQKQKFKITTPPPVIASKAAQIFDISVRENLEPISLQCDWRTSNNIGCDKGENNLDTECSNYEYRRKGFHRNTFRLSLKRNHFRNSAVIEWPGRYINLYFHCIYSNC